MGENSREEERKEGEMETRGRMVFWNPNEESVYRKMGQADVSGVATRSSKNEDREWIFGFSSRGSLTIRVL